MFCFGIEIQINLPLLPTVENTIKKSLSISLKNFLTYRISYFSFPFIPEMSFIYLENALIYNYICSSRLQIDFVIPYFSGINNSCEFLIRMYRFPCTVGLKNQITFF
jgi:hypothetical protein